jgi:hypothetical protein
MVSIGCGRVTSLFPNPCQRVHMFGNSQVDERFATGISFRV